MNTYNGSEGVESMKLRVGEVKLIIGRVTQTTACLERELERMGEKVRHIEQSMSEIVSDAAIEDIVNEVVEAVSARERGKKIYMQKGMGIPRTTGVTRFRKANIEAHKVKEHVKRLVDDMEVKRLKSKGRKQMHQSTKRNFCAFANEGVMSGKNADLLRFLFRKNFVGEEKWSTEVARYGEFAVTRMEFQCLSPATSLSCKVINICAAYLDEADGDCWFLPTYFGDRARCNEEQSCFANWVASTVDMCGLWRFHRRLRFCSKIFIPLHDRADDHWFLLVMNLLEKKALLWDSYPDPTSVARRMCHAREVVISFQCNRMFDVRQSQWNLCRLLTVV
ncbi:uncharacterized protein LOC112192664 isoform X1 [Rosa chinensis]|uniref:uncharacterized protein LOC112192664 isoform X1 n=1 Tax=Rosa chinensis TaxID=74649 RepID=UPI000D09006C|nr:uncharacterized protein LOC112192664 isoform X1 [Rosa chinensis]